MLGQCSPLAVLNLGSNDIGTAGAERLAGVLGQCSSLQKLNLEFNGIDSGGKFWQHLPCIFTPWNSRFKIRTEVLKIR